MKGLHTIDGKHIKESSRLEHEYVQVLHERLPAVTVRKIKRIINACLDDTIENANKFVYTRTGIALGHGSKVPHADLKYVWAKITRAIVGCEPEDIVAGTLKEAMMLKGMGAVFQWIVSGRDEFWLVKFTPTGKISILNQREVNIAEYWIGDQSKYKKVVKQKHSAQDLVNKFNSARL